MERAELEFGAFGTIYYDGDGRVLGSMQYGVASLFPRAAELPGGPPSDDAMLVTCAYLRDESSPWVLQSLFLAAIGEARDRGAACLEAAPHVGLHAVFDDRHRRADQNQHEKRGRDREALLEGPAVDGRAHQRSLPWPSIQTCSSSSAAMPMGPDFSP